MSDARFNLETAIATWHRLLRSERSITAEDADELESHLRDEVDALLDQGLGAEAAFRQARRRMGDYTLLEQSYRRVYWKKVRSERRAIDELRWRLSLLTNYLSLAIRRLRRQKGYTAINVLGLSVGLACSFFILLWVHDELRYDRFHAQGDQLYRVLHTIHYSDGRIDTWDEVPMPLAAVLERQIPEIIDAVLVTWEMDLAVARQDEAFRERGLQASPALFEIFSFPFIQGDPRTALDDPDAVVISEKLAQKYFGPDWRTAGNVLGQSLLMDNEKESTVTGVFKDIPRNSTLQFDFVRPVEEFIARNPWLESWESSALRLVVRLREGAPMAAVSAKIATLITEHREAHEGLSNTLSLQPYGDTHLYGDFEGGQVAGGRIDYVRLFILVAIFILLIACINFMNLATARSMHRAREIGVRKAIGATRGSLMRQFLGESMLVALLAFFFAMLLVVLLLPAFNDLTRKSLAIGFSEPGYWLIGLGLTLVVGVVSGSYPALFLSSFNVVGVLRQRFTQGKGGRTVRRSLVVFQFTMSVLLILGTLTVYEQLDFIRNKNLGWDRENVVYMRLEGSALQQYEAFRQTLLQKPGIVDVTSASQTLLRLGNSSTNVTWEGKHPDDALSFHVVNANYGFVETMRIALKAGRTFSASFGSESTSYIVNERAARAMGMEDPVGQQLTLWEQEGPIIGLVDDFHSRSLYTAINPVIIRFAPRNARNLFIRMEAGKTAEALAGLETVHEQFNPGYPFAYRSLEAGYEQLYRSETVLGTLANVFAGIAVFISCLGLFGLAAFTAEQRTKEIGVRKVLGASVPSIVVLLSREFTRLVLIAFVVAAPLAYLVMHRWLNDFAYRIDIPWMFFLIAGLLAIVIAWLTVGYQSIKVARTDPVKTLRYE